LVFHDPFTFAAFWTYFTCATASCKRAPFDLAEAESELVAGFHTEYSGLRWSFFFMAEYGSMFAVSGIATLLFLGGWNVGLRWRLLHGTFTNFLMPVLGENVGWYLGNLLNAVVFVAKGWILVFVMMWVRWTLPRLRIDQVMMTCLKYLLPLSCALLAGVSVWRLILPEMVQVNFKWVLFGGSALLFLLMVKQIITWAQAPPGTGMPGMWRNVGVTGYQGAKQQ